MFICFSTFSAFGQFNADAYWPMVFPVGRMTDNASANVLTMGFNVNYRFSEKFENQYGLAYHGFGQRYGNRIHIIPLTMGINYYLTPGPIMPFITFRMGGYITSGKTGFGGARKGSFFGISPGFGMIYPLHEALSLKVATMYHIQEITGHNQYYLGLEAGINFKISPVHQFLKKVFVPSQKKEENTAVNKSSSNKKTRISLQNYYEILYDAQSAYRVILKNPRGNELSVLLEDARKNQTAYNMESLHSTNKEIASKWSSQKTTMLNLDPEAKILLKDKTTQLRNYKAELEKMPLQSDDNNFGLASSDKSMTVKSKLNQFQEECRELIGLMDELLSLNTQVSQN